ncbi:hypothetical protein KCU91_g106, partial [Aureobasidium melanogenum]
MVPEYGNNVTSFEQNSMQARKEIRESHLSKCLETLRRQRQRITLADHTTSHGKSQLLRSDEAEISCRILDKEDFGLLEQCGDRSALQRSQSKKMGTTKKFPAASPRTTLPSEAKFAAEAF